MSYIVVVADATGNYVQTTETGTLLFGTWTSHRSGAYAFETEALAEAWIVGWKSERGRCDCHVESL